MPTPRSTGEGRVSSREGMNVDELVSGGTREGAGVRDCAAGGVEEVY